MFKTEAYMKKEDNGVKQIDREKNLKFKKIWNIVTKTEFRKNYRWLPLKQSANKGTVESQCMKLSKARNYLGPHFQKSNAKI